MTLVSRYTPFVYLFGFLIAAIITVVLFGIMWLAKISDLGGVPTLSTVIFYKGLTNMTFYITFGISTVIGSYVVIATAVQMAMVEFMPEHVDKEGRERSLLFRGVLMVFLNAVITLGTWSITRSAVNIELGESVWSAFFWMPIGVGVVFVLAFFVMWPCSGRLISR